MKKSEIWSNYKGVPQCWQNQFSAFLSFCLQFSLPLRVDRKTNLVYVREFGHHPDLQGEGEHREDYPLRLQSARSPEFAIRESRVSAFAMREKACTIGRKPLPLPPKQYSNAMEAKAFKRGLKEMGLDFEVIAIGTGLTVDEISKL